MVHCQPFRLIVVSILCLIVGCDRSSTGTSAGSSKIKIGFVVKQPDEPWFQMEWKFAQQAADARQFDLIKIAAPDGEKALTAIDNLAAQGAQGLVICTPDVRMGPAIVAKAKAANIKLLTVDDQFVGADGKFMTDVPHVGISARNIGRMVGKALFTEMSKRKWPMEQTAVLVVTFEELDTARERTDGEIETLVAAGFPADRIFRTAEKTTDVPGAFDAANVMLTQHPEVKKWLVCAMNDSAVIGAIRALEGRQFGADGVIGIGINGTDCINEFKKQTPTGFFASVLLTARRHGYDTADMMYRWIKDGSVPPKVAYTEGILIDRSNWEKVLKEQGMLD